MAGFPLAFAGFAAMFLFDRSAYLELLREDGPVENLTAVAFVLVASTALLHARRRRRREGRYPWFHIALGVLGVLAALEEISWGQRIVGFETPSFFKEHARQQETNVHNVVQKWTTIKVRDVTPIVFVLYGVALPIARARSARLRIWLRRRGLVVPPLVLGGGFVLGGLLMFDYPTRREEEIGELFLSICVLLMLILDELRRDPEAV